MNRIVGIWLLIFFVSLHLVGQSPHGKSLKIDCKQCHSPESWSFSASNAIFNHDSTLFPLNGQHKMLDCKQCHKSLEFQKVSSECNSCHTDIHQNTVGNDCARCHNTHSWIVTNVTELHERTSFPLIGVHAAVDCRQCHQSESTVRFSPTGMECVDCHRSDFNSTTRPNHPQAGFSNDCASCHNTLTPDWRTDKIDHSFFPLEKGHKIDDCTACHKGNNYSDISSECISCHQQDFNNTLSPSHVSAGFTSNCIECHTTDPGWKPAIFTAHDGQYFPIYSGSHKGVWMACNECHLNENNYSQFTCIRCHTNPENDEKHNGVSGYVYSDNACLACHPTGEADGNFDHSKTSFPLTGAHIGVDCIECHAAGYAGTPTACVACHQTDYNGSSNPNHTAIGIGTDCATCHTTTPGWEPASFPEHDAHYALNGAHARIANDCVTCHHGDYNNTPNTCVGCHNVDYQSTTDPPHQTSGFGTDCASCHSENAWAPSTFDHDAVYFPIYSGKHKGVWNSCSECHTVSGNFSLFSCVGCHQNPETNDKHSGVSGYIYNDQACLACHPTGDASSGFDHNSTAFPLTGGHIGVDCIECHAAGYQGTPTACVACHQTDYEGTTNPNHSAIGLGTDCVSCHTTSSGWEPASFPEHNTHYALNGAHALIANDCAACHHGDYNNTPNTCVGCHNADYQSTTNPNHITSQFPTDCASCHSENAWQPATFNHDGMYFPIYSGKHKGEWNACMDCHNNPNDFSQITCTICHQNPETNNDHAGVPGYVYNSDACLACHPTGDAGLIFNHNTTAFPLTGAHQAANCLECHASGYQGTPTNCVACHNADYQNSVNPKHPQLGISTDCASCHTTAPGWAPASFAVHDEYYALTGAHISVANDCAACHQGNYNNTPNTCVGCHQADFNATTNPNHVAGGFPTDCATCHTTDNWSPSNFNHNNLWPLTGKHQDIANDCAACHQGNYNNTPNTCVGCHQADFNATTNPNHVVGGFPTDCATCHTTVGWSPSSFDHNNIWPLTGKHQDIANDCAACHQGNYNNTPNTCVGCHQADFNATTNPNHVAGGFPTECTTCHTTGGWSPSSFDHNNIWPLTGAHQSIAENCNACHQGNYNNTPNTCVGCHQSDYNASTNPNHVNLNIPTDCAMCHSTNPGWAPATFPIHDNYYQLQGAHITIQNDCAACHQGNYNNTPNTCVGCHQSDYNGTTNPNHAAAQFPTTCESCHSQNAWIPSTFDHDDMYFPIYRGKHKNEWNTCGQCHPNTNNYTVFNCIGCHNNQSELLNDHEGVNNYQYNSNACYACHPNGEK